MFFNGFTSFGEIYSVVISIDMGNAEVQHQTLQAPEQILQAQFIQLCQQLVQDARPMSCKMERYEEVWDRFDNKMRSITVSIEFDNKAMERFKEEESNV